MNRMSSLTSWLCCLIAILVVIIANQSPANSATFKDATGVDVEIDNIPRRVICLSPHLSEIVCYLGAKSRLVGRTSFCNNPKELTKLPAIGGFSDFSAEKILRLKPDLVLASRGNPLERIDQLRKLGIKVYACDDENSLVDIYKTMTNLCSILWLPKHSVFKVKELKTQINSISKSNLAGTKCLYVSPESTLWTCNKDTFISEVIERSGMTNVARDLATRWPLINAEQVLIWQPDVLLVPVNGGLAKSKLAKIKQQINDHPILNRTPAAKLGNIIIVDADQIMRPSPGLLSALKSIISQLEALN